LKTELLLEKVDKNILSIVRLSSYTSIIVSGLTAAIYFIAMMSASYFILCLLGSNLEHSVYKQAIKWFVLFYALNEFTKLIIFSYTLKEYSNFIINSVESVEELVEKNRWIIKSYISDLITFLLALFSYVFILFKKSKKIKIIDGIIIILFFIIIFIITHHDFLEFIK
jgi:hypothetical protein